VFQQVRPHPEEAANGSRECAPDDRLRAVSKDGLHGPRGAKIRRPDRTQLCVPRKNCKISETRARNA